MLFIVLECENWVGIYLFVVIVASILVLVWDESRLHTFLSCDVYIILIHDVWFIFKCKNEKWSSFKEFKQFFICIRWSFLSRCSPIGLKKCCIIKIHDRIHLCEDTWSYISYPVLVGFFFLAQLHFQVGL